MRGLVERRRHKRFRVREGVHVIVRSNHIKVGQMIDVNMQGLKFRYFPFKEPSAGLPELHIFSGGSAWLRTTSFKTIWDQKAKQDSSSSSAVRLCGAQFDQMTDAEQLELQYFIQHHVTHGIIRQASPLLYVAAE
jgi:hypothetical protein